MKARFPAVEFVVLGGLDPDNPYNGHTLDENL